VKKKELLSRKQILKAFDIIDISNDPVLLDLMCETLLQQPIKSFKGLPKLRFCINVADQLSTYPQKVITFFYDKVWESQCSHFVGSEYYWQGASRGYKPFIKHFFDRFQNEGELIEKLIAHIEKAKVEFIHVTDLYKEYESKNKKGS